METFGTKILINSFVFCSQVKFIFGTLETKIHKLLCYIGKSLSLSIVAYFFISRVLKFSTRSCFTDTQVDSQEGGALEFLWGDNIFSKILQ